VRKHKSIKRRREDREPPSTSPFEGWGGTGPLVSNARPLKKRMIDIKVEEETEKKKKRPPPLAVVIRREGKGAPPAGNEKSKRRRPLFVT